MKKALLFSLVAGGLVTNISVVRKNSSGYLFVTLLNGRKSTNVYFGKKTSEMFTEGEKISVDTLRKLEVVVAANATGDQRLKMSLPGESETYTDLRSIMGLQPAVVEDVDAVAAAVASEMTERTTADQRA